MRLAPLLQTAHEALFTRQFGRRRARPWERTPRLVRLLRIGKGPITKLSTKSPLRMPTLPVAAELSALPVGFVRRSNSEQAMARAEVKSSSICSD